MVYFTTKKLKSLQKHAEKNGMIAVSKKTIKFCNCVSKTGLQAVRI